MRKPVIVPITVSLSVIVFVAACARPPAPVSTPCGVLNAKRYSVETITGKTRKDERALDIIAARGKEAGCWK